MSVEDVGAIAVVGFISAIVLIIASIGMGDDHQVLKVGFLLFALTTFFMSISMSMINIGYYTTFVELTNTLGLWIYVFGIIYFIIIVYFILYAFSKLFDMMGKDKDQRLNY